MPASHGFWCNSRTIPIKCRNCGKNIFYFSYDCGCSLLFDALRDPWPFHFCLRARKSFIKTSTLPKKPKILNDGKYTILFDEIIKSPIESIKGIGIQMADDMNLLEIFTIEDFIKTPTNLLKTIPNLSHTLIKGIKEEFGISLLVKNFRKDHLTSLTSLGIYCLEDLIQRIDDLENSDSQTFREVFETEMELKMIKKILDDVEIKNIEY
ncbi:MAG: hypothetical protein EAX96_14415 [Candidatus Lokiarchaeota archaeon]|nr:hypothetical protein [Candidatus Lokiarchaeota archaeon]